MNGINNRVKNIREKLGYNQSKFSEEMNIKQPHLSFIESGKKDVTTKLIFQLVKKFNVSADWLITGKGPEMIVYAKGARQRHDATKFRDDIKKVRAEVDNIIAELCNKYGIREELVK